MYLMVSVTSPSFVASRFILSSSSGMERSEIVGSSFANLGNGFVNPCDKEEDNIIVK